MKTRTPPMLDTSATAPVARLRPPARRAPRRRIVFYDLPEDDEPRAWPATPSWWLLAAFWLALYALYELAAWAMPEAFR